MGKKDARVDAYIKKSADFEQPILQHIRQLIHAACPQVEETIKWRHPSYVYRGLLCITPAFKHHCALIFWQKEIRHALEHAKTKRAWGNLRKLTTLSDLPSDAVLTQSIVKSAELNESRKKKSAAKPVKRRLVIPVHFMRILRTNQKALAAFQGLAPSHQREYIEWIAEAKRDETRVKRQEAMLKMLCEGITRHWKYER